jgi:hypothetical protein
MVHRGPRPARSRWPQRRRPPVGAATLGRVGWRRLSTIATARLTCFGSRRSRFRLRVRARCWSRPPRRRSTLLLGVPARHTAVCADRGTTDPTRRTLGSDITGRVTAVGAVTRFEVGAAVSGDNLQVVGGFAEYTVAPESALAHKPDELTFAEASSPPRAVRERAAGNRRDGSRAEGADQRRRRRLGGVRDPARQAGRRACDRDRQRGQARISCGRSGPTRSPTISARTFSDFPSFDRIPDLVATRSPFACRRGLALRGRYQCVGGAVRTLIPIVTIGALVGRPRGDAWGCSPSSRDRATSSRSRRSASTAT